MNISKMELLDDWISYFLVMILMRCNGQLLLNGWVWSEILEICLQSSWWLIYGVAEKWNQTIYRRICQSETLWVSLSECLGKVTLRTKVPFPIETDFMKHSHTLRTIYRFGPTNMNKVPKKSSNYRSCMSILLSIKTILSSIFSENTNWKQITQKCQNSLSLMSVQCEYNRILKDTTYTRQARC